jgi:hypothetical protein
MSRGFVRVVFNGVFVAPLKACLVELNKQLQLQIHHEVVPNSLFKNNSFVKAEAKKRLIQGEKKPALCNSSSTSQNFRIKMPLKFKFIYN